MAQYTNDYFFERFYRYTVNLSLRKWHKASNAHKPTHNKTAILSLFAHFLVNC